MPSDSRDGVRSQFLRFRLGERNFAFDVLAVREILFIMRITPLPNDRNFLSGLINLRGRVVPVVDLRRKFAMPAIASTVDSSIIIVDSADDGESTMIGALVDSVHGVFRREAAELEEAPPFGLPVQADLVEAVTRLNEEFVFVLDPKRLFSDAEIWMPEREAKEPAEV